MFFKVCLRVGLKINWDGKETPIQLNAKYEEVFYQNWTSDRLHVSLLAKILFLGIKIFKLSFILFNNEETDLKLP